MKKLKKENSTTEIQKIITNYLYKETDIGNFVNEISIQSMKDYIVYGYCPWNYLEEFKLNQKLQGFLK